MVVAGITVMACMGHCLVRCKTLTNFMWNTSYRLPLGFLTVESVDDAAEDMLQSSVSYKLLDLIIINIYMQVVAKM